MPGKLEPEAYGAEALRVTSAHSLGSSAAGKLSLSPEIMVLLAFGGKVAFVVDANKM